MATFLDLGFFEGLRPLLVFLIIFAVVYGVLSGTKIFGGSKSIDAIIALVIGLVMMVSKRISEVILVMIPWFILLAVFAMLIIIVIKMFGVSDDSILSAGKDASVYWTIIIIALVLLVASISYVFGQEQLGATKPGAMDNNMSRLAVGYPDNLDTNTTDYRQNASATLYHPKILGFILIMVIALFTVQQLSRS